MTHDPSAMHDAQPVPTENANQPESRRAGAEPSHPPDPLRIAIVAGNMSFRMGGEAARPIHYARYLRDRGHQVSLITHARCQAEFQQDHPDLVEHTTFIPDTRLQYGIWRLFSRAPERIRVFVADQAIGLLTERAISRLLAERAKDLDVVHNPIPISPRVLRAIRTESPLLVGPLNGDIAYPPAYAARESWAVRTFVKLGRSLSPLLNRLFPTRPTLLLVSNERTERSLPFRIAPDRIRRLRANAVDLRRWNRTRTHGPNAPVRIATMSRLVRFKCVDVLIEAFAASEILRRTSELVVIGSGDQEADLKALAQRLGVADKVQFPGWMPHSQGVEELLKCDVFAFPSLQDPGGAVIMEASCLGLPIVCADWGGPGEYLPEGGGVAVPVKTPQSYVGGIRAALEKLAVDPGLRAEMGARGRKAAEESFGWQHRIDVLERLYREAVELKRNA